MSLNKDMVSVFGVLKTISLLYFSSYSSWRLNYVDCIHVAHDYTRIERRLVGNYEYEHYREFHFDVRISLADTFEKHGWWKTRYGNQ